uniref:Uncharacterized protein n=1 Tax=Eiseniibacteriota bacterium TaxID=2212470 RepID=A0A832I824_UNCEI
MRIRRTAIGIAALLATILPLTVFAQTLDAPTLRVEARGHGKLVLEVTAGASGAPDGFALYWMKGQDFVARAMQWPTDPAAPGLRWAFFTGAPSLNLEAGTRSFRLSPHQSIHVEIGDLDLETGLTSNSPGELGDGATPPVEWFVTSYALDASGDGRSPLSNTVSGLNTSSENCTYTIGYWKNHPQAWPVSSLVLGDVAYDKEQLLAILRTAVKGNGLVSLAHQLIAARLNIANGAAPGAVDATIAAADAQIGALVVPSVGTGYLAPSSTSAKTQVLDDFNNGLIGPGHCGIVPVRSATWGSLKTRYR